MGRAIPCTAWTGAGIKGWSQAGWQDVIFRLGEDRTQRQGRVREPTLRDILGSVVLGRLTSHAGNLGLRGSLDGRLLDVGEGSIMQVRADGLPLAELTDRDGDGRVDLVLLAP